MTCMWQTTKYVADAEKKEDVLRLTFIKMDLASTYYYINRKIEHINYIISRLSEKETKLNNNYVKLLVYSDTQNNSEEIYKIKKELDDILTKKLNYQNYIKKIENLKPEIDEMIKKYTDVLKKLDTDKVYYEGSLRQNEDEAKITIKKINKELEKIRIDETEY